MSGPGRCTCGDCEKCHDIKDLDRRIAHEKHSLKVLDQALQEGWLQREACIGRIAFYEEALAASATGIERRDDRQYLESATSSRTFWVQRGPGGEGLTFGSNDTSVVIDAENARLLLGWMVTASGWAIVDEQGWPYDAPTEGPFATEDP